MKKLAFLTLFLVMGAFAYAQTSINPGDSHTVTLTETVSCSACPICPPCSPDRFPNSKIVDPSGNGDYTTIKQAVDIANLIDSQIIFVKSGTYNEAIDIYRNGVQLVEFPGSSAVIDCTGSPDSVDRLTIHGDNVRVEGFEITNCYEGIKIYGDNSVIRDNSIYDNRGQGILVVNSSGHKIRSNRLINNGTGCSSPRHCHELYFSNYNCEHASSNNEVKYNRFEGSGGSGVQFNGLDDSIGVCPQKFVNNEISHNDFINNANGLLLYYNLENSDIRNNNFKVDEDIRARTNESTPVFLAVWGSQNNDIKDNTFYSNQDWSDSGQPKGVGALEIYDDMSKNNDVDRNTWNIRRQWWQWGVDSNGDGIWRSDFNGAYQSVAERPSGQKWDANGYVFTPVGNW